jgi:hypothetical protein
MTITAVAARRDGPAGGRPGGVTVPAAALARDGSRALAVSLASRPSLG